MYTHSMNLLLIGSGGREHAIAWKLAQSPRLKKLYVAPGNPGTAQFGENSKVDISNHQNVTQFCKEKGIDLVIIGPEDPLASGLTDTLLSAGIKVFGPTQQAAEIESSKAFAKAFMLRHNIPTAQYQTFTNYAVALKHVREVDYPVVIKASGLAAGKGVIIPETIAEAEKALQQVMLDHTFGRAGDEVVIEERLSGPEVSLLAFCDGKVADPMIPAQDHKRIFDGDKGPNTGGMGAYAPVPVCPPAMVKELTQTILQPTLDGLRAEGRPFTGVLYAGLMLTASGPKVIEFNVRFGDPETQVILPLLDADLLTICEACASDNLANTDVKWKGGAAACVVLASDGYPGIYKTGEEITGLEKTSPNAYTFHASTKAVNGKIVTHGGRVLCATGWGDNLGQALKRAYTAVDPISFTGMQYRTDIGHRALEKTV